MTGENNDGFFDSLLAWGDKLTQTLAKIGDHIVNVIGNAVSSIWNVFLTTVPGKICAFIWDMISFLFYGVRSIVLLLRNTLTSILNGFIQMFDWLGGTFGDLSYLMGSTTSLLISMFIIVLLIIVFGFIFRFFTGKYFYNRRKK